MKIPSNSNILDFWTLFYQWNRSSRMEAKIKSDHSKTKFNRFLMQKLVYRIKIRSICNIFDFRTLFHQRNRSSRMEAKIKSDRSETTFNRFLMQKLVYRMKIRSICNIFDFRTLFHQVTDDQKWRPKSSRIILKPLLIDFSCKIGL